MSISTMSLRAGTLLGSLLIFSACTPEAPATGATADGPAQPQPDLSGTKAERAAAAGLSAEDVAYLDSTEVPVYVPVAPQGWRLEEAFTERDEAARTFVRFYSVTYRTPDSTCVSISGMEGPREPWASAPPHERPVVVPGVPTAGPVRLGWGVSGEDAAGWEDGLAATEGFGAGPASYVVGTSSDDGCRMATPEDVETLLTTLRALDPDDDVALN